MTIVCELTIVCLDGHESLVIDSECNEALTINEEKEKVGIINPKRIM